MGPANITRPLRNDVIARRRLYEPKAEQRVWSINVLVVDDDAADTSLILNVLKRHPNVSATHAIDEPAQIAFALPLALGKPCTGNG